MKRLYFFIIAGLIILVLIGFWVYSFLYGSPSNEDSIFTNLGIFGQNNTEEIYTPPVLDEVPTVDVATEQLRQLTTKAVIGARIVDNASTTVMRYVEAGTGHIFDIDLVTGQETRISNISIPAAEKAVVSPSGNYAAVRSGLGNEETVTLVDITTSDNPTSTKLPNQIRSFAFGYNNELLFTEISLGQTEGKGYLPSTAATHRLFTAPFVAHEMAWSESSSTSHIIYTKPTASMIGYAYEITASGLKRFPYSGFGLTITQSGGVRFVGRQGDSGYGTIVINRSGQVFESPGAIMPEKCVGGTGARDNQFCASPFALTEPDFPDAWYKGRYVSNDNLWEISAGKGSLLVYPSHTIGRNFDVQNLQMSEDDGMLYFINRIDNTLWLYEI
ncbi:MAG: hypothetical protein RLZZ360_124 [Candidatus Parcubacteria bacterium]|jgi:hypothetical protein